MNENVDYKISNLHVNKEAIRKLYYKHIFLMIVVSSLTISVILYKLDTHIIYIYKGNLFILNKT